MDLRKKRIRRRHYPGQNKISLPSGAINAKGIASRIQQR